MFNIGLCLWPVLHAAGLLVTWRNLQQCMNRNNNIEIWGNICTWVNTPISFEQYFILHSNNNWPQFAHYKNSHSTAKMEYRTLEKSIPRKETARPQSQFLHSYICERSVYLFGCSKIFRPIVGIYKSLTYILYERKNWDRSRAVWFLGIHKSDFLCSVQHFHFRMSHNSSLLSHNPPNSHELHCTLLAPYYLVKQSFSPA